MVEEQELEEYYYFPSSVYSIKIPKFLDAVKEVSKEYLESNTYDLDEIYPVHMSPDFSTDPRIFDFCSFVSQTGWDILNKQGYKMSLFNTFVTAMWTQKHYKHSLMEQHIHGDGNQLVGFYFLETPENCSRPLFHDPRSSKIIINLPEEDMSLVSSASNIINFNPEPGTLMISNSWLPHSFTRHASDIPVEFIHFNINVALSNQSCDIPDVEII